MVKTAAKTQVYIVVRSKSSSGVRGGRSFAVFEGAEGLTFPDFVFDSADGVDADQSVFGIRVERKATPGPNLRVIGQSSLQRVHVHVVELFDSLFQTPNIEIVEAALPEARQRIVALCKC